jgi:hypothetical protein
LIKRLKDSFDIVHGKHVRNSKLHLIGTMDLSSNDYILDVKCYKKEELDLWFNQLILYSQSLCKDRIELECKNLYIVNLLQNKYYKFCIKEKKVKQTKVVGLDIDDSVYFD